MGKSKSLGRGLGELLGEIEEAYDHDVPKNGTVVEVPLNQIQPNPYQPRKHFDEKALLELGASIKQHGLIQPIVLIEDVDGYILVAGERRWRASKLAKLKTIRAVIVSLDEIQMRQHALIENIQREQLNIVELAQAYDELLKIHGVTQEELGNIVHKSRSHITNTLRLLQLSKRTQMALVEERISAGHAKVLVGLPEKEQELMVDSIYGQKLNVRETEQMVKRMKSTPTQAVDSSPVRQENLELSGVANKLVEMGLAVSTGTNKISIVFENEQQVDLFLDTLS